MKSLRITYRTTPAFLVMILGIMVLPVGSMARVILPSATTGVSAEDIEKQALYERVRLRAEQRMHWSAIEDYNKQQEAEEGASTGDPLLDGEVTLQRPATVTGITGTENIDPQGRALLRRYARAGYCPDSLKRSSIPNFYEMCRKLVGEDASPTFTKGFLNDSIKVRRAVDNLSIPQFKLRMQMLEQARDSSNRREDGNTYLRPSASATE